MELTSFQELIFSILSLVTTSVISLIGYYIKTKIDISKYGFDNDKFERIIDNGISYANKVSASHIKRKSVELSGHKKLGIAKKYINNYITTKDIKKYKLKIEDMIERKLIQK